jgi:DUF2075 family protein
VAATEFECQGLELDWVGLCWGNDLCDDPDGNQWLYRQFLGNKWCAVRDPGNKQYLLNKYRVLLTRAREGMVIWVPPGDPGDESLDPRLMNATFDYFALAGVPTI